MMAQPALRPRGPRDTTTATSTCRGTGCTGSNCAASSNSVWPSPWRTITRICRLGLGHGDGAPGDGLTLSGVSDVKVPPFAAAAAVVC